MSKKAYHHGDLRTTMIEKGLEIIIKEGKSALSLRRLASTCGVSHAAPYAHFADKNELMNAILEHISQQFAANLREAINEYGVSKKGLYHLSCAYVMFFAKNPNYFDFIFSVAKFTVDDENPYEPHDILKNFARELLLPMGYSLQEARATFLAHFAFMHGLAAVACMATNSIEQKEAWTKAILSKNHLLYMEDDENVKSI